jgi:DNA-binding NtrC family response regulator
VLLDITMPRMGGLEALPALRAIRPEVPIVLMSGYSEDRMASHRVSDDAHLVFVSKPFDRDAIALALSRAVGGKT